MQAILKVYKTDVVISGESDNGNSWEKQKVIFYLPNSEKKLAIDFMGEKKTAITKTIKPGQLCNVTYNVESREVGYKWFTNANGISIVPLSPAVQPEVSGQAPQSNVQMPPESQPAFDM